MALLRSNFCGSQDSRLRARCFVISQTNLYVVSVQYVSHQIVVFTQIIRYLFGAENFTVKTKSNTEEVTELEVQSRCKYAKYRGSLLPV